MLQSADTCKRTHFALVGLFNDLFIGMTLASDDLSCSTENCPILHRNVLCHDQSTTEREHILQYLDLYPCHFQEYYKWRGFGLFNL